MTKNREKTHQNNDNNSNTENVKNAENIKKNVDTTDDENKENICVEQDKDCTENVTDTKNVEEEQKVESKEDTKSKEQEYLFLAQKTQAEFENYKKRTLKAESEAKINGIVEAVKKFLPVLDAFDVAQKQETNEEYINNNAVIIKQLNKALEDLGVQKIDALGKQFDYNLHNAIMVENVPEKENNEIIQVFQEGYILKDKVIRYSIVKINKK